MSRRLSCGIAAAVCFGLAVLPPAIDGRSALAAGMALAFIFLAIRR